MRARDFRTLQRKSSTPVWVQIAWRVAAVLGLVALAIAVHWLDREGLRDNYDGHVSFADVVYFTMISITTTGYGDIAPVSTSARMFDALIVTPIRVFVILLFVGTAYSFIFRNIWDRWHMAKIQRALAGHVIVCGFGTSGSQAVAELIKRGCDPRSIVVIDQSDMALERAKALGCNVLDGDATRDTVLTAVHAAQARAIIVSAGRDDTSILITLTARHLAPDVPISVVVRNEDNELPARVAGGTTVINPVSFAGLLLASSCSGPHVAEYMSDLASHDGRVQLVEREVASDEVSKPLSAIDTGLGVRLYRGERPYSVREPEAQRLEPGDRIVEIRTTARGLN
jgi:voltage-gated potassium channel